MAKSKETEPKDNLKKKKLKCKKENNKVEKKYSPQAVQDALQLISKGKSLREAENSTGVPKSTLFRIVKSDTPINHKKGAPSVLTAQEEEDIVKWILYCSERGFSVNKKQLLDTVKNYIIESGRKNPFTDNRPGYKWYRLFIKRHSNLNISTTTSKTSTAKNDLGQWFTKLKDFLQKRNLLTLNPKRIFNLDESTFKLVPPKNSGVIVQRNTKAIDEVVSSNKKNSLNVIFTATASGQLLVPAILFKPKTNPKKELLEKIPGDWGVCRGEEGWLTPIIFYKYIVNIFYKWLVNNNYEFPIILYVDNRSLHLSIKLVKFCEEKQIELIGLYPNSKHIIQPLNVGFFHVFKDMYKVANNSYRVENNIADVKNWMFAEILKKALDSYDFTNCIINGFKACGLVPFDPDAVQCIFDKKKKDEPNSTTASTEEVIASDN